MKDIISNSTLPFEKKGWIRMWKTFYRGIVLLFIFLLGNHASRASSGAFGPPSLVCDEENMRRSCVTIPTWLVYDMLNSVLNFYAFDDWICFRCEEILGCVLFLEMH